MSFTDQQHIVCEVKAIIKEIYKYSNIDERKSLIQKFGKEMFAGVPIIGLSRKEQLEEQFNNLKK